jgi:hypothetical protein
VFGKEFSTAIEAKQVAQQEAERQTWVVEKSEKVMKVYILIVLSCVCVPKRHFSKLHSISYNVVQHKHIHTHTTTLDKKNKTPHL